MDVWDFICGEMPEISSLPKKDQLAFRATALKELRRRSFLLRYLPEISGLVCGVTVYGEVMAYAPFVATPGVAPNAEVLMWYITLPSAGCAIGGWIGHRIRNYLMRRRILPGIRDDLRATIKNADQRSGKVANSVAAE